jgi:hypothetical protein
MQSASRLPWMFPPNEAARKLAARQDMRGDFTCERMYLKGDPGLPLGNIYGITTFEAG